MVAGSRVPDMFAGVRRGLLSDCKARGVAAMGAVVRLSRRLIPWFQRVSARRNVPKADQVEPSPLPRSGVFGLRGCLAGNDGLTLIEVTICVFLAGVMIAGLYTGITRANQLNYASAQRVCAFGLCKELLEQMRGAEYDYVVPSNFPPATVQLTHLGGSARVPLMCQRSCGIVSYPSPYRKVVTVTVAWNYCGRSLNESIAGAIFYRGDGVPKMVGLTMGGLININPNNSPDNEFTMSLPGGGTITRADLTKDYTGYVGVATCVIVKPKGNGNQNGFTVNGEPYKLWNYKLYTITSDSMNVNLYNDNVNPSGKAVGKWWISIAADAGTIVE